MDKIESFKQQLHLDIGQLSDEQLSVIVDTSKQFATDAKFRNELVATIKDEERLLLLSISGRLAEEAYNHKSKDYIEAALILHLIENFKWDIRENIIYLTIIWHVAKELGMDPRQLFTKAVMISSEEAGKALTNYLDRPDNTLDAMGLQAIVNSDNKITFEQLPPPWQK